MTETKWTKGPWFATKDDRGNVDDFCIGTEDYIDKVATCSQCDAHLIAAAPDLYDALKYAADPLCGWLHGEALSKANKALSKARGEST